MKKFIFWKRSPFGSFSIQASETVPDLKAADGKRHTIRQIIELPVEHRDLTLHELEKLYPLHPRSEELNHG